MDLHKTQMKQIAAYLDVPRLPRKDLLNELEKQHEGSCNWLTRDARFQAWLGRDLSDSGSDTVLEDGVVKQSRFFWLNGPPGSGKSVAAAHVIDYLETHNADCYFFFFKDDSKATVSDLLLSLAFQMAWANFEVRQSFVSLIENGDGAYMEDYLVIWNHLFLGGILKLQFSKPQFWVIDALDECPSTYLNAFLQEFAGISEGIPLRMFATSRPNTHVDRLLRQIQIHFFEGHTGKDGSIEDIAAYIRSKPCLADIDDGGRIISEISNKSQGVFLWASLIVDRLDDLYSVEDIKDELEQIPPEMNDMYSRILDDIKKSPSAGLAKCILTWVVSAPEPLTTGMIKRAIKLDIGKTIIGSHAGKVFSQICRNLITVDDESRVQVMHQTVRDFLYSTKSESYISHYDAHERMAIVCLEHLNRREFGSRQAVQTRTPQSPNLCFDEHVDTHFSYHVANSSCNSTDLLKLLNEFMNSNILAWIERTAIRGKLSRLIKTAHHLRRYISRLRDRLRRFIPPFTKILRISIKWANDLTHLVTVFGPYLVEVPFSIRTLIPPLCPTTSILHRTFAKRCRPNVVTTLNEVWDERLSSLFLSSQTDSLACSPQYLAVGLSNGIISIFDSSTLELITSLKSGQESAPRLVFGSISNILASCGPEGLKLWKMPDTLL